MKEIICKDCGAIFTVQEEMPENLECFCQCTKFDVKEQIIEMIAA